MLLKTEEFLAFGSEIEYLDDIAGMDSCSNKYRLLISALNDTSISLHFCNERFSPSLVNYLYVDCYLLSGYFKLRFNELISMHLFPIMLGEISLLCL